MPSDQLKCRVCGLLQDEPPWGEDGRTATFDICVCCGVEFGYEDSTRESVRRYRQAWLDKGGRWQNPKKRPANWSLEAQLNEIPAGWGY
jgi:hypothetical protein